LLLSVKCAKAKTIYPAKISLKLKKNWYCGNTAKDAESTRNTKRQRNSIENGISNSFFDDRKQKIEGSGRKWKMEDRLIFRFSCFVFRILSILWLKGRPSLS